jgi:hypothetical protein
VGAYIFQMTKGKPIPESEWLPVTTTLYTTYTVEGLESACYYSFRVAAVTPDGITDFCTPVEKIVTYHAIITRVLKHGTLYLLNNTGGQVLPDNSYQ